MTDLLQRAGLGPGSRQRSRRDPRPGTDVPRPVAVSAVASSAVLAVSGLVVAFGLALIVWLAGSQGSTGDALRAGAIGWLVGHGSAVTVSGVAVTAVPLGVPLLLAVAHVMVSGRISAASSIDGPRDVLVFAGTSGLTYALVLALTAWLSASGSVAAGAVRSAVVGFALAGLCGAAGAARQAGLLSRWWDDAPHRLRAGVVGAAYASVALLGSAFAVTVALVVFDASTFGRLWSALDTGLVGGVGLLLLCLVLLPNVVLWTAAVLLGPGIAVGTNTSVTLVDVQLDRVPGLPLLAALPGSGPQPGWVMALAALPLLAGAVAGAVTSSRLPDERWVGVTGFGIASGAGAGLLCGLLVAVSAGAVGPGRMSDAGPEPLLCLAFAVLSLGVGGAAGAVAGHYRVSRADDRAD